MFVRKRGCCVAQVELRGDVRAHPAGVDDERAADGLAFVGGEADLIGFELELGDLRLLPEVRAVLHGHRREVGVGVLAKQMRVGPERRRERRQLVRFLGTVALAFPVIHERERALHAAVGADVVAERVEAADPADLRHAVLFREDAQPHARLRDERLADGEAGMSELFDEQRGKTVLRQDAGEHRTADTRSENRDVVQG